MEWGVCGKELLPDFLSCWNEDYWEETQGVKWLLLARGGIVQLGGVTMYYCISSDHLNPFKRSYKNKKRECLFSVDSQLKSESCLY